MSGIDRLEDQSLTHQQRSLALLPDPPQGSPPASYAMERTELLRLHSELAFTLVYVTHSRAEAQEIGMRTIELGKTGAR